MITRKHRTKNNKTQKKTDPYSSANGFQTTVWGPLIWKFLHIMSFNYPVSPTTEQKRNYRNFVLSLVHILPCGKCRLNLCKNFKKMPLEMHHMETRETFSKYVYELHEAVNKMLNKKSGITYEDLREDIEHFRAKCSKKNPRISSKKIEKGCTEPLGENIKQKCVINIIPL